MGTRKKNSVFTLSAEQQNEPEPELNQAMLDKKTAEVRALETQLHAATKDLAAKLEAAKKEQATLRQELRNNRRAAFVEILSANPKLVDVLAPTHSRTTCSDENVYNSDHGCNRCILLKGRTGYLYEHMTLELDFTTDELLQASRTVSARDTRNQACVASIFPLALALGLFSILALTFAARFRRVRSLALALGFGGVLALTLAPLVRGVFAIGLDVLLDSVFRSAFFFVLGFIVAKTEKALHLTAKAFVLLDRMVRRVGVRMVLQVLLLRLFRRMRHRDRIHRLLLPIVLGGHVSQEQKLQIDPHTIFENNRLKSRKPAHPLGEPAFIVVQPYQAAEASDAGDDHSGQTLGVEGSDADVLKT